MVNLADPPLRAALDRLQSQSENAALEEIPGLVSEAAAIAASEVPAAMRPQVASALALVADPRATGAELQAAAHAVVWAPGVLDPNPRYLTRKEWDVRRAVDALVRAAAYVRGGYPEDGQGWQHPINTKERLTWARSAIRQALMYIYIMNA